MSSPPDPGSTPAYDLVAREYARRLEQELDYKPLDRALLAALIESTRGRGRLLDAGCGPGHVAAWLHAHGAEVAGLDLSPAMIEVARARHPELAFEVGDLLELGERGLAGIVALYAIVNLPPAQIARAATSMFAALAPGGLLLVSFHMGHEQVHLDEWWGHAVSIDFWFFERAFVERALEAAGFVVEMKLERRPYPEEHPSQRAYLLARRPPAA